MHDTSSPSPTTLLIGHVSHIGRILVGGEAPGYVQDDDRHNILGRALVLSTIILLVMCWCVKKCFEWERDERPNRGIQENDQANDGNNQGFLAHRNNGYGTAIAIQVRDERDFAATNAPYLA